MCRRTRGGRQGGFDERPHDVRFEEPPERLADRLEDELCPGLLDRRHAAAAQPLGESPPGALGVITNITPVEERPALVRLQLDAHAPRRELRGRPEVLEPGPHVARHPEHVRVRAELEAVGQRPADERPLGRVGDAHRVGDRVADPPARIAEPVVVDEERALPARADVRVREHVLANRPVVSPDVVQEEVAHLGELGAPVEQGHDDPPVVGVQALVHLLDHARSTELHPVLLGEALELAVPEHRQPGHRRHERRDAEVLVARAELLDRSLLVGVVHEVDEALEDLGVELEGLAHDLPVVGVAFVPQQVHERAVVHAVHAEGPDEVALHEPERLGEEERAGRLGRDPIDDVAPELGGHRAVEVALRHRLLGAGGDRAAVPGQRMPQALDVPLREDHRRVESDDRELPGDVQDRLDDRLASVCPQVVELGRVVPREARPVVAVVGETVLVGPAIEPPEDDRGVRRVVVVVIEKDADALVRRQVRATEGVRRIRRFGQRDESLRMLDDPARIDPHVVRHHVRRQPNPA